MRKQYYLEKVKHRNNQMTTIKISAKGKVDHIDCIVIHGTPTEVTNRAIKILQALNDQ